MSTTALVRSSSSSNSLVVQKPATPASTSPITLPKLNLTPQQTSTPAKTPTPQKQQQQPAPSPAPSTPGRWQHPRMDEVVRRQNATNFDNSNVRAIIGSLLLVVLSFYLPTFIPHAWTSSIRPYDTYTLLALRLLLIANASFACTPLLRKPDACEDIPLTPAQRQRLGLPPMSRPATPAEQAQYVTPPRYSRSATPHGSSGANSLRAQASGSPLSGRGTPVSSFGSQPRRASGSPMTPSGAGVGGRRSSYNASPLGASDYFDAAASMGTPTKIGNPRASVGLNSKWLYEKGRASPQSGAGNGGFMNGAWGTGSVFS